MKDFKNTDPIQILDEVLAFMASDHPMVQTSISHEQLHKTLKDEKNIDLSKEELSSIIIKLQNDVYIREVIRSMPFGGQNLKFVSYIITLEGIVHNRTGGYKKQFEEINKIKSIEDQQKRQATQLLILNWLVAIGTLVAAVYSTVEILKTFGYITPINK